MRIHRVFLIVLILNSNVERTTQLNVNENVNTDNKPEHQMARENIQDCFLCTKNPVIKEIQSKNISVLFEGNNNNNHNNNSISNNNNNNNIYIN